MTIALVDDSAEDRMRLENALRKYDSIHQLGLSYCHYSSGEEFLAEYQPFRFTVIFLDIFMEGMSGIDAARKIRETDDETTLVFLTTSEVHRPDAFSVFASAYLSKSCSTDDLIRTMDHVMRLHTEKERHLFFAFDRRDYSLRFSEIVSLETDGNYLSIVDRNGKTYRTRMTFSSAVRRLDNRFLTLMKGIVVNMDCVSQIQGGQCLMQNGAVFPLRVRDQKELRQKWLNYKFAKIRAGAMSAEGGAGC